MRWFMFIQLILLASGRPVKEADYISVSDGKMAK